MSKKLWIKNGHLVFFENRITICEDCVCECKPKTLAKYILMPNTTWDLSPYMEEGYAKPAQYDRRWLIIECSHNLPHYSGVITRDGTLVGLPDEFRARQSYPGYMRLQQCCIDENGNVIEPSCETWGDDDV